MATNPPTRKPSENDEVGRRLEDPALRDELVRQARPYGLRDPEDLAHDALVRLLVKRTAFDRMRGTVDALASTILRHAASDSRKREARLREKAEMATSEHDRVRTADPATQPESVIYAEFVRSVVDALPDAFREVIRLYYFEDMTLAEIGAELGYSQAKASRSLQKALKLLRAELIKLDS